MRSEGYGSWLCVCVCVSISLLERMYVLKTLSRTQRARKVKKFVAFCLKLLRCRDPALPTLYGYPYSPPFWKPRMRMIVFTTRVDREAFLSRLYAYCGLQHCFKDFPTMQIASVREPDDRLASSTVSCEHVTTQQWKHRHYTELHAAPRV